MTQVVLVVGVNKVSESELLYRQSLPLNIKVRMTETRLRYFINEYNVIKIKPKKSLKQIIDDDGWCFPSKDVAEAVEAYRRGCEWAVKKLNGLDGKGKPSEYRQQYKKWLKLAENYKGKISAFCCDDMKENPVAEYEKKTRDKPIIALMACESARRKEAYLRTGCNSFESNRPMSKPLGFWVENDVLQYIVENNLPYAKPYGKIIGQLSFCNQCHYSTTGEKRTGCMFCPVGMHLDNYAKFERLKKYNPKLHDYVMEELGLIDLIEWVKNNY